MVMFTKKLDLTQKAGIDSPVSPLSNAWGFCERPLLWVATQGQLIPKPKYRMSNKINGP